MTTILNNSYLIKVSTMIGGGQRDPNYSKYCPCGFVHAPKPEFVLKVFKKQPFNFLSFGPLRRENSNFLCLVIWFREIAFTMTLFNFFFTLFAIGVSKKVNIMKMFKKNSQKTKFASENAERNISIKKMIIISSKFEIILIADRRPRVIVEIDPITAPDLIADENLR